jgi:hypothetical protein
MVYFSLLLIFGSLAYAGLMFYGTERASLFVRFVFKAQN